MSRPQVDPDLVQLQAAESMAEAIVCTFERCQLEGQPLAELQKTWFISTALLAFDDLGVRLEKASDVARTLREIQSLEEL